MKLAVHGAAGRMGQSVVRLARADGVRIVGAIEASRSVHIGKDVGDLAGAGHAGVAIGEDTAAGLLGADVVIDFSHADSVPRLVQLAARTNVAIVSGTTRLDARAERAFEAASRIVPVLWSPNMSVGVHVLARAVADAVKSLGAEFDVEIVETHHRQKVDAPSGTANLLAAAVKSARGDLSEIHGREGNVGARRDSELAVFALRGGDVIGDHTVHLLGQGEHLEFTHRATNRDLFARGALRVAQFLCGKPAGMYSMADVVGA